MPHMRIMAVIGFMPKTSGSRIAMPATGPMPGSAPMSVPTTTPSVTKRRLTGLSAIENPIARWSRNSMASVDEGDDAFGQGHAQPHREHDVERDRREHRHRREHAPRALAQRVDHRRHE